MSSLLDLIIPFFMSLIMALSGYMVALVGDWIKKVIIIPVTCMLLFDGFIVSIKEILIMTLFHWVSKDCRF